MFEKISIGIKTFLRDEQLFNTIAAIQRLYAGAQMIIADCGDMTEEKDGIYADLERAGHIHIQLPFDAGFGAMSNAIAYRVTRPYLLIGSDDFDFASGGTRLGLELLEQILEQNPTIDIASGRVNSRPYEYYLLDLGNGVIKEVPAFFDERGPFYHVDLTVNYSLMRTRVLDMVRWDNDVRIGGGEHGAFFLDCKRAGLKIVWVPGVNIDEQQVRNTPRYGLYRRRAADASRPCFRRRGVKKYILGDGTVDYDISFEITD